MWIEYKNEIVMQAYFIFNTISLRGNSGLRWLNLYQFSFYESLMEGFRKKKEQECQRFNKISNAIPVDKSIIVKDTFFRLMYNTIAKESNEIQLLHYAKSRGYIILHGFDTKKLID